MDERQERKLSRMSNYRGSGSTHRLKGGPTTRCACLIRKILLHPEDLKVLPASLPTQKHEANDPPARLKRLELLHSYGALHLLKQDAHPERPRFRPGDAG